jgi:hypothetical protein
MDQPQFADCQTRPIYYNPDGRSNYYRKLADGGGWTQLARRSARGAGEPPFFLDGCHSWRTDGPIVAELFPQFATKDSSADD